MAFVWIGFLVSQEVLSLIISGLGFILSIAGAAFVAGLRWGTVKTRLDLLDHMVNNSATKEQLSGVKEDLAEIKGMFRMVPRDGSTP
jgi:hypothetical protein